MLTADGHAGIGGRPFGADLVYRPVENARFFFIVRTTVSVPGVRYDHVVGARRRWAALDFVARASCRSRVTVTQPTRSVFPTVVHLRR